MSGFLCSIAGATYAPPAAAATAVKFNGSSAYLAAGSLNTSSASDSKYMTLAVNFYVNDWVYTAGQGTNLMHLVDVYLPGGNSFYVWINGGRLQIDGGIGTVYEQAECSVAPFSWNQVVMYIDTSSRSNCRIYVNGVSRTLDSGGNPNNTNFNWNTTGAQVTIGRPDGNVQGAGAYFNGSISHFYLHGGNVGAPTISNYWDATNYRPRDLGTDGTATGLAQPYIYHYGNAATFITNNGTGFSSYTLSGADYVDSDKFVSYTASRTPLAITTYGNAQIATDQYKFDFNSIKFDGVNDYLQALSSSIFTGDFTMEMWVRPSAVNIQYQTLIQVGTETTGRYVWHVYYDTLFVNLYGSGTYDIFTSGGNLTANTWAHVAVVRSGSTVTIYINGTSRGTNTAGVTNYGNTGGYYIGCSDSSAQDFGGYMDEIRISNTARYTGTFTPSTSAFVNDANTLLLIHATPGPNGGQVFYDDNGL